MEKGLIPDVQGRGPAQKPEVINQCLTESITLDASTTDQVATTPLHIALSSPDSGDWSYKLKLSKGNAGQTLQPESWVVLDVIGGRTVTMKHTTNSYNLITGFSRWWDHPILSIMACPLHPAGAGGSPSDCHQGSSDSAGEPLRIVPPGEIVDSRLPVSFHLA